jgi:hypothetical protein
VLRRAKQLARRPFKVVAVALANKRLASHGLCWLAEPSIGHRGSRRRKRKKGLALTKHALGEAAALRPIVYPCPRACAVR